MAGQVCIGGPMDGQRVTILHGSSFKSAPRLFTADPHVRDEGEPGRRDDVIYRRETLAAPPAFSVDVWVAEHLRPDEALAMLVDGYRSPR